MMLYIKVYQRCAVLFILFRYSSFMIRNFNIFSDKCGALNEILEPAIFIYKTYTNIISKNIDVEFITQFISYAV